MYMQVHTDVGDWVLSQCTCMYMICNIKYWNGWYSSIGAAFGNNMNLVLYLCLKHLEPIEHIRIAEITMIMISLPLKCYGLGGVGKIIFK